MPEDLDTRSRESSGIEIPAEVAVEGAAGDASPTVSTGWPQGIVWLHGGEFLAEGFQGPLYRPECGLGHFPFALLPALAPIAVEDRISILGQVTSIEIQDFSAPPTRECQSQNDGLVS